MVSALILLGIITLFSAQVLLPLHLLGWVLTGVLLLTAGAALIRSPHGLHAGLFCSILLTVYTLPSAGPWPVPLLLALALYVLICFAIPGLRERLTWLRMGRFTPGIWLMVLTAVLLSSVALVLWYSLAQPDIAEFRSRIPDLPVWVLIPLGLGFAVANAAAEEAIWRGILMESLEGLLGKGYWALLVQAASFGVIHIGGFPQGWSGVGLSSIYGLMLGYIRQRSNGMLAPWIAHVAADAVIFTIVLRLVSVGL